MAAATLAVAATPPTSAIVSADEQEMPQAQPAMRRGPEFLSPLDSSTGGHAIVPGRSWVRRAARSSKEMVRDSVVGGAVANAVATATSKARGQGHHRPGGRPALGQKQGGADALPAQSGLPSRVRRQGVERMVGTLAANKRAPLDHKLLDDEEGAPAHIDPSTNLQSTGLAVAVNMSSVNFTLRSRDMYANLSERTRRKLRLSGELEPHIQRAKTYPEGRGRSSSVVSYARSYARSSPSNASELERSAEREEMRRAVAAVGDEDGRQAPPSTRGANRGGSTFTSAQRRMQRAARTSKEALGQVVGGAARRIARGSKEGSPSTRRVTFEAAERQQSEQRRQELEAEAEAAAAAAEAAAEASAVAAAEGERQQAEQRRQELEAEAAAAAAEAAAVAAAEEAKRAKELVELERREELERQRLERVFDKAKNVLEKARAAMGSITAESERTEEQDPKEAPDPEAELLIPRGLRSLAYLPSGAYGMGVERQPPWADGSYQRKAARPKPQSVPQLSLAAVGVFGAGGGGGAGRDPASSTTFASSSAASVRADHLLARVEELRVNGASDEEIREAKRNYLAEIMGAPTAAVARGPAAGDLKGFAAWGWDGMMMRTLVRRNRKQPKKTVMRIGRRGSIR